MMKILSLSLALTCIALAPAHAKTIDLKPPVRAVEDPGSATGLLYQKPDSSVSIGRGLASSSNCTDTAGVIYRKGSPGFSACLRTRALVKPEESLPGNRGDSLLIFGK
ncbi:MAG: hypothetical protein EOP11_24350 [Proteobacteria bacterium]|nr:MAG: hypothetical protein EOP11_24350 [Pseudomonadota bacterium]